MPEDSDQYCIFVEDVRKRYKNNQIDALDGISFKVEYGKIFGFLGPNGAGKTTINILTTLIRPSSGKVKIFDKDVLKYGLENRKRIGIVLQQPSFEPCLTVQQSIDLYGLLWGIAARKRRQRVQELLDIFELLSIKDRKIDDLSIGQRRRVQVAREFIHDMDLLFLDEPTVGLDPSARRILLDYIKQQVKNGLTVFFTTHIMEEAEYLCDQIAIIIKGKIIAVDSPNGLKQKYGCMNTIKIKLKDYINNSNASSSFSPLHTSGRHIGDLKSIADGEISNIQFDDSFTTLKICSVNAQEIMVKVVELLSKHMIQIENIAINPTTLEEVFLNILNVEKEGT